MRIDETSVRAKDGAIIPTIVYGAATEKTRGTVIVSHGFGEHSGSYRELAGQLGGANYSSVVFDQRGHGGFPEIPPEKKEKYRGRIPGYQSFMDDVDSVADMVREMSPGAPIVLYGHSMGGNIAANYALRRKKDDLACVVLESPWLGLNEKTKQPPPFVMKVLGALFPNVALPKKLTKLSFSDITSDGPKQKEFDDDALYHNRMTLRLISGINGGCSYALENASGLSIPTYLAYAKDEKILSNIPTHEFIEKCGPKMTGEEYDSRHAIHNDRSRELFYRNVIAFLNAHCPENAPE